MLQGGKYPSYVGGEMKVGEVRGLARSHTGNRDKRPHELCFCTGRAVFAVIV